MADAITHKTCSACKQSLPIDSFGLCPGYKDGRRGQCTQCRGRRRKRPQNPVKAKPEQTRRTKLKQKYGLTESDYASMLEAQGGRCAICDSANAGGRWGVFHVDHCHRTGKVRGLLCHTCNTTLGRLGDDLQAVLRYARYLKASENRSKGAKITSLL